MPQRLRRAAAVPIGIVATGAGAVNCILGMGSGRPPSSHTGFHRCCRFGLLVRRRVSSSRSLRRQSTLLNAGRTTSGIGEPRLDERRPRVESNWGLSHPRPLGSDRLPRDDLPVDHLRDARRRLLTGGCRVHPGHRRLCGAAARIGALRALGTLTATLDGGAAFRTPPRTPTPRSR